MRTEKLGREKTRTKKVIMNLEPKESKRMRNLLHGESSYRFCGLCMDVKSKEKLFRIQSCTHSCRTDGMKEVEVMVQCPFCHRMFRAKSRIAWHREITDCKKFKMRLDRGRNSYWERKLKHAVAGKTRLRRFPNCMYFVARFPDDKFIVWSLSQARLAKVEDVINEGEILVKKEAVIAEDLMEVEVAADRLKAEVQMGEEKLKNLREWKKEVDGTRKPAKGLEKTLDDLAAEVTAKFNKREAEGRKFKAAPASDVPFLVSFPSAEALTETILASTEKDEEGIGKDEEEDEIREKRR
ncbi:hypothetical protein Ancab_013601 [Ancistrocladus abbreviatus]